MPAGDISSLAIGITGHRFLDEPEKIKAGLRQAFRLLADTIPERSWTLITSLAEGADRLVIQEARQIRPFRLVVPLPLPLNDYTQDFSTQESRTEFTALLASAERVVELPRQVDRHAAYAAAGRYIVEHSDVLMAVWDGQEPQGAGGTGDTIAEARRLSLPIAWVHAGNRQAGTCLPTTLGGEQGLVTYENMSF